MTELISDKKTFRKLKEDPTLKRERALQRTLREINTQWAFTCSKSTIETLEQSVKYFHNI